MTKKIKIREPNICDLPYELILIIFSYLSIYDALEFSLTTKSIYNVFETYDYILNRDHLLINLPKKKKNWIISAIEKYKCLPCVLKETTPIVNCKCLEQQPRMYNTNEKCRLCEFECKCSNTNCSYEICSYCIDDSTTCDRIHCSSIFCCGTCLIECTIICSLCESECCDSCYGNDASDVCERCLDQ